MKEISKSKYFVGVILVLTGAVLFAGKAVLVKYNYIHYHVDTVSLLALRMLFSAPFYLIILFFQNKKEEQVKLTTRQWFWMFAIGLVGYYLASLFDFWGLNYITASVERLILFIYPTIVVVVSAIFLKKTIHKIQYVALVITYLGVALAFIPDLKLGLQKDLLIGCFLIFLSAFTYALFLVGSGEMIQKVGALRFTCYSMLISTGMVIIHYLFSVGKGLLSYEVGAYWLSLSMAVFSTVIPSFMISEGIRRIGSGNASIIGSIGPVATIIMANVFLGEQISAWQLVGTFVVLCGVLMISWKGKK
ncbi:DMT family transporter [Arcicella rosea]|uniref:Drug/metabolite transporter (DMT)-like permease n=1 Tax=Arcicella rosea TaxID=502909 RepID=A0A841EH00_9BACT|nr:DMT family transporter [Arcicella rosea]MBB6001564.1 drug/metabolite transporter (DMT)-like permease [Arcicella rosea]